jgi:glutamate carboxypeptidase
MKSGFIQALYAMRGQDLDRVALIATTDEETGSATSRKLIEEVSKKAKAVLVMEASLDGKLEAHEVDAAFGVKRDQPTQ